MKVVGEGEIELFEPIDECPHAAGEDELWQESFVLYMWDVEQQVYVFFRMAQVPNKDVAVVWLNAWTPDHQYKLTKDDLPMGQTQISNDSISVGDGLCRYQYNGDHVWQVKDADVEIELTMVDAHQGLAYYANTSAAIKNVLNKHIEAAGNVTGNVTVKGKTYTVNGTGWRDHSWGRRDWFVIRNHRFFPAMFGKEFSFFCMTLTGEEGSFSKNGVVIRNDTVQFTQDFDIVAYMGEDGVGNAGGQVTLRLDGETHVLDYQMIGKSAISMTFGFPCVDGMCKVTMGDKVGVGVCETSTNPLGGRKPPHAGNLPSSTGLIENGIFPLKK